MIRSPIAVFFLAPMLVSWGVLAHPHKQPLEGPAHEVEHAAGLFVDGEIQDAVPLLENAIKALEAAQGTHTDDLVVPLGFLGSSYLQLDRAGEAVTALSRARAITWLENGRNNARQLPLIYVEAEALKSLGRLEESEQRQREALEITRSAHGEGSMQAALALGRLAEWKAGAGEYEKSIILYSQAIDQARDAAGGRDHADMLPLMQGMARTFLAEGFVPGRALPLVERVVQLVDREDAGFDPVTRIEARMLFGDLLMRFSLERQALETYQDAWGIASRHQLDAWLQRLARPEKVAGKFQAVDTPPSSGDYFVFRYDLKDDGRPVRVALVDTNAEPVVSRWALQRFREVRFRPALVDGRPLQLKAQSTVFVY